MPNFYSTISHPTAAATPRSSKPPAVARVRPIIVEFTGAGLPTKRANGPRRSRFNIYQAGPIRPAGGGGASTGFSRLVARTSMASVTPSTIVHT
jgi:hypothetical protein